MSASKAAQYLVEWEPCYVNAVAIECQEPGGVGALQLKLGEAHLRGLVEGAEKPLDVVDQGLGKNNMSYQRVITFPELPGLTQLEP